MQPMLYSEGMSNTETTQTTTTTIYGRKFQVTIDTTVEAKPSGSKYGEYTLDGVRGAKYYSIRRTDGTLFFVSARKFGNVAFEGDSFTDAKILQGAAW